MRAMSTRAITALFLAALLAPPIAALAEARGPAPAILHMLDYVGVDYPMVVENGRVLDAAEYAEQQEFSGQVLSLLERLPEHDAKPALVDKAQRLARAVDEKAPGADVSRLTRELAAEIVIAYDVQVAPDTAPSLERGEALYADNCISCHGAEGRGDGPAAAGLTPAPTDFHERERQSQRSVYSLFSTISGGVDGTAMRGFTELDEAQRWALAFYVSRFFSTPEEIARGRELWQQGEMQQVIPDLRSLAISTPDAIGEVHGTDGVALLGYLRRHPGEVASGTGPAPLAFARERLQASVDAYADGDHRRAYDLAIQSYLEGFELTEAQLSTVNASLRRDIEQAMAHYRSAVQKRAPLAEVESRADTIFGQIDEAARVLEEDGLSPVTGYVSALVILLREGFEAILVLAAIITFLIKADRRDALPWVHAGWIGALALGFGTWFAAGTLITISGAGREITEGITALFAAAMLLYIGFWLHRHAHAERWRQFIEKRLHDALSAGTIGGLVLISFLAVYREILETVLFYQTLWVQAGPAGQGYIVGGFLTAAALLTVLAWFLFRYSRRLPIGLFFRINAIVLFVLAVVFAGKGIAALQEAGKLPISPITGPHIELLGVYPNLESLGLQLLLLAAAGLWLLVERRRDQHTPAT